MKRLLFEILMSCIMFIFFNTIIKADDCKPLNILFVVDHFPAPSQTFIVNIMVGLVNNGHNVSILSFHRGDFTAINPLIEKYSLLDRVIYQYTSESLPECDIIFCQFGYLGRNLCHIKALKEWMKNKKLVVCFRGSDLTAHVKKEPKIYKKLFKKADLFLPVCDYFRKRLINLSCSSKKIIVHYSAINCSQFCFKQRKKPEIGIINIVSVCRLVEKKGIDIAISAIAKVLRKHRNVHFTIVGDGPERPYLKKLIRELNIAHYVTLYGWASRDEVINILDKAHIFLLPSLTSSNGDEEGIANALKEAMAMGVLSIATWHAGTSELIDDGVSGFLVPQGNSMELAKTIEHVIEHPEQWFSVQYAARQKVEEKFEINKSIKELEKIFYALIHD